MCSFLAVRYKDIDETMTFYSTKRIGLQDYLRQYPSRKDENSVISTELPATESGKLAFELEDIEQLLRQTYKNIIADEADALQLCGE